MHLPRFHRDNLKRDAPVAQLDRVNASEALGHKFESCRAHHDFPHPNLTFLSINELKRLRSLLLLPSRPSVLFWPSSVSIQALIPESAFIKI